MFGHNNQGTAEDVSVRCRIRRSAFASNKESAQEEDAVCTMRVWHSAGTSFVDLTSAVPLRLRKNKSQEYKSESKENGCWGSETHDSDSQSSRRSSSKKQRRQQQKQKQKQQRLQQQQQQQQQQQEQIDQRSRALGPQLIFTTICPVGTLDNSNLRNSRMVNAFTDTSSFGNENGRRMGRRPSAFGGDQAECKLSEHHARQMEQQSWHDERHRGGRESPAQTAAAAAGATSAEPVIVPTRDIMLVETATAENHETMCTITTISHGFYECVFDSNNGKMVFVAFLQNYLSENRFVDPTKRARRANNAVSPSSSSLASTDGASFDVEAFTAHRMAERIQTETTTEKVRRKIGRIASSLDEFASLFTDCVCWCGNPATASDKRSKSNQEAAENDAYCGQMGGGYDTTMCGRGMEFDMSPEENTTIASCFNAHSADMSRYKMKISPLPSSSPGRRRGSNGSRSQQESAELDPAVLSKEYSSPKLSLEYSADLTSTI